MPVEVRLETIPLSAETASKPVMLQHYSRMGFDESQGGRVPDAMEVVVLENERVCLRIAPLLAGRIVGWKDKSLGKEIDPSELLRFSPDPIVELESAAFRLIEAEGPDEPAGVVLFGLTDTLTCSWQASISLAPESAWADIEFQTTNRDLGWEGNAGFGVGLDAESESFGADFLHVTNRDANGLIARFDLGAFVWNNDPDLETTAARLPGSHDRLYSPRQSDRWRASLAATFEVRPILNPHPDFACALDERRFGIQSFGPAGTFRLVLGLESGSAVETGFQLYTEKATWINLESLPSPVVAAAILDASGKELWRNDTQPSTAPLVWVHGAMPEIDRENGPGYVALANANLAMARGADPIGFLNRAEAYAESKAAALELRGDWALAKGLFGQAIEAYDLALAYNAEDALLWWRKAYAMRLAGDEDAGDALANAHFLSPLEFMLRVEAFLSQASLEAAPSPLVAPLAKFPEQMRAAACQLLDLGQTQDAAKWIDECLRHADIPALKMLLADLHLSRLALVESYSWVESAYQSGRTFELRLPREKQAVGRLQKEFSSHTGLAALIVDVP